MADDCSRMGDQLSFKEAALPQTADWIAEQVSEVQNRPSENGLEQKIEILFDLSFSYPGSSRH